MSENIAIHIGYESIPGKYLTHSPHMRQRISGILESMHRGYRIIHLSKNCQESLINCSRKIPDVALLSILLPADNNIGLDELIAFLQKHGTKIIILYKQDEENAENDLRMMQKFPGIAEYVQIKELKELLPKLLNV